MWCATACQARGCGFERTRGEKKEERRRGVGRGGGIERRIIVGGGAKGRGAVHQPSVSANRLTSTRSDVASQVALELVEGSPPPQQQPVTPVVQ